jgi:hypothetical protein
VSEQLLPDLLTPCAPADLYAALKRAWASCCQDSAATRGSLLVILAHWALETGWGHACHRWNLGNAKWTPGCGHDYTQFRCNEILDGKIVWLDPPAPGCQFVAFPDLEAGAAYYLTGLRGTFRAAWTAVIAGDPSLFCHMLKLARYYTADEALYTAGVVRCYHQLDGMIPMDSPSEAITLDELPPDPTSGQPDEPHT